MRPALVTPPAETPVSLAEAKVHLRVEHDDDDALIDGLIDAATAHLDGWRGALGRCIVSQEWEISASRFCATGFRFPMPDVTAVSVVYDDAAGDEQAVSADDFAVAADALGSFVRWRSGWASPTVSAAGLADPVRYRFTCGLVADAEGVPGPLKVAISMLVAHWYAHRAAVDASGSSEVPMGVDVLIRPYRVARI